MQPRQRWPQACMHLRLRTTAGVSADMLGRTLALDGAAAESPSTSDRGALAAS